MNEMKKIVVPLVMIFLLIALAVPSGAVVLVQCPGDIDGDAVPDPYLDPPANTTPNPDFDPNVRCMHLGAGDGFILMADGYLQYMFGFSDLTGINENMAMDAGMLAATFPAPKIVRDEGDKFYLNLTNVGMVIRPDLFDPHTVHFHGFPNASGVFDGVPDASISINMGSTLPYFYNLVEPGTYMYHCHVEATEHMQMGMLGNLYVRPGQNRLPDGTVLVPHTHLNNGDADAPPYGNFPTVADGDVDLNGNGLFDEGTTHDKYAYNDGDASTLYNVEYAIQIGSFDSAFHDASYTVQTLPFALMRDNYPMLNGRGYPDTVNPASLTPPPENGGKLSQNDSSLITADAGDKILLRLSNLNVTRFYTLASLGIPMKVVGGSARLLRGPTGKDLYFTTNSVTMGGGESTDVILEVPTTATSGTTYFLYTTNFNYLSNNTEDFGGMMTEIRIN